MPAHSTEAVGTGTDVPTASLSSSAVATAPYEGLDPGHGTVLFAVVREGPMPLDRFEAACRNAGLMPGAALEAINDWGFERFDEAVLEETDEVVSVPGHLLPSLAPN